MQSFVNVGLIILGSVFVLLALSILLLSVGGSMKKRRALGTHDHGSHSPASAHGHEKKHGASEGGKPLLAGLVTLGALAIILASTYWFDGQSLTASAIGTMVRQHWLSYLVAILLLFLAASLLGTSGKKVRDYLLTPVVIGLVVLGLFGQSFDGSDAAVPRRTTATLPREIAVPNPVPEWTSFKKTHPDDGCSELVSVPAGYSVYYLEDFKTFTAHCSFLGSELAPCDLSTRPSYDHVCIATSEQPIHYRMVPWSASD